MTVACAYDSIRRWPLVARRFDETGPVMATEQHPVIPGAESWSVEGTNGCGALVLHGFTGNPSSMRDLAEAFAEAGFSVELPRLPGHGTDVSDMVDTRFSDWFAAADAAYKALAAKVDKVVVAGLSMGGTLTAALAIEHPAIAGIVLINAAVEPMAPEVRDLLRQMGEAGPLLPAIGGDIAKPDVSESAYPETPIAALLSLAEAGDALAPRISEIAMPVCLMNSPQDHVVAPTAVDYFMERVTAPVERVILEKSFHVATLDYDAELIETSAVAFAKRVCGL